MLSGVNTQISTSFDSVHFWAFGSGKS